MPGPKATADWRAFLLSLSKSPNVAKAARAAGVSRRRAYQHREEDPQFAAAWDDAKEAGVDRVEERLYGIANGREPNVHACLAILKAHRREVYGDPPKVITQDELDRTIDGIVERLVSAREAKARGEG
jgi:hypothetical protein